MIIEKIRHGITFFLSGKIRAGIHLTDTSKFHNASYYSQIYTKYKALSTEGTWSQGMNSVCPHWKPLIYSAKKKAHENILVRDRK